MKWPIENENLKCLRRSLFPSLLTCTCIQHTPWMTFCLLVSTTLLLSLHTQQKLWPPDILTGDQKSPLKRGIWCHYSNQSLKTLKEMEGKIKKPVNELSVNMGKEDKRNSSSRYETNYSGNRTAKRMDCFPLLALLKPLSSVSYILHFKKIKHIFRGKIISKPKVCFCPPQHAYLR